MTAVPVIWCFGNRGDRCHGLVEDALAGEFAPPCFEYTHYMELTTAGRALQGGIVVVSGGVQRDYADEIASALDRMKWALVLLTADEETKFPWRRLNGPNRKIWVQMPCGDKTAGVDRVFPIGYPTGTRQLLKTMPQSSGTGSRRYPWSFIGQMPHSQRQECVDVLGVRRDGGMVRRTSGFYQGYAKAEYLQSLLDSYVAVSPAGMYTTDCFRTWEALECGCLPVCDRRRSTQPALYDYWTDLGIEPPPFPTVGSWLEFNAIADRYNKDHALREADTKKALVWWSGYKRQFALNLESDLRSLGVVSGEVPERADTPHEVPRELSANSGLRPSEPPAGGLTSFGTALADAPAENFKENATFARAGEQREAVG